MSHLITLDLEFLDHPIISSNTADHTFISMALLIGIAVIHLHD